MKLRNVGILLLFVVVLAWFGCSAAVPGVPISGPAPDFTLHDLSGNPVRLSEMRGKVVLLNFWATWCPPCLDELPRLFRFFKSQDPSARAKAIVEATTHFQDPSVLARVSRGLGDAMPGLEIGAMRPEELIQHRGW